MSKIVVNVLAQNRDGNLVFHLATMQRRMSKRFVLKGDGERINGNPYLVYGPTIRQWLTQCKITSLANGQHWATDLSILVFSISSGDLNQNTQGVSLSPLEKKALEFIRGLKDINGNYKWEGFAKSEATRINKLASAGLVEINEHNQFRAL